MPNIAVHPLDVVTFYGGGTGDMAETWQVKDAGGNGVAFCLCSIRIHFTGESAAISDTYPVILFVDSLRGPAYDRRFFTWAAIGEYNTSSTTYYGLSLRVEDGELRDYIIPAGDYLGLTWTNPAPTTTKWTATVNTVPLDKIRA